MKNLFVFLPFFICVQAQSFFYPDSYLQSREKFRQTIEELRGSVPNLAFESFSVPTKTDADLTTDVLYLPQTGKTQRLLIMTSGIHGVEAFTGAAIQIQFLKDHFRPEMLKEMGILIVHAVNPFGFHFHRRVSEQNIDLNRNFSANEKLFTRKSEAYENFEDFLNPTVALKAGFLSDVILFCKSLVKLILYGKKQIAQIAVGGQYQNPKGIYFGGQSLEPNPVLLRERFLRWGHSYDKILHVDLHTGYGERGKLHFFSTRSASKLPGFAKIFEGYAIDLGEDEDFYETSGNFDQFTLETFKNQTVVIPMTFEFGTLDSQTIMGGFHSLKNMIYENQGVHYGYTNDISKKRVEEEFMNMFNPSDPDWRKLVMKTSDETLKVVLSRFSQI